MKRLALALAAAALSGCIYTHVKLPRAYRSPTPRDVDAKASDLLVSGESCLTSVLYLVSWGDRGYAAAVDNALEKRPGAVLYDVQVDTRIRSYMFGLYSSGCTIVRGRAGRLAS